MEYTNQILTLAAMPKYCDFAFLWFSSVLVVVKPEINLRRLLGGGEYLSYLN
jgi:hypothetical protein